MEADDRLIKTVEDIQKTISQQIIAHTHMTFGQRILPFTALDDPIDLLSVNFLHNNPVKVPIKLRRKIPGYVGSG
jgi:phage terminase large subunit